MVEAMEDVKKGVRVGENKEVKFAIDQIMVAKSKSELQTITNALRNTGYKRTPIKRMSKDLKN